jgi:16S rRNA (guanine(966)-N(2))-methyltransferase RsmD
MMRIITGKARGVRLDTLPGTNTRPTAERAKEAVFSMLQFELQGRIVLDLFAGSGQMALEAISRGAESAVLIDVSREAVGVIERNVKKTRLEEQCRVVCAEYSAFCRSYRGPAFDLVFLDPPYAARLVCPALRALMAAGAMADVSISEPSAVLLLPMSNSHYAVQSCRILSDGRLSTFCKIKKFFEVKKC